MPYLQEDNHIKKEMKIKIIDGKTEKVNKVPDNPMANLPTDLDIPINIIEE